MASSRRAGTNESISSYGSGKDYTEGQLSTWEVATDNDNVTGTVSPVLEVYKEGASGALWDDTNTLDGSTNNATYFRIVRAAAGNKHSGIPLNDGSVAGFRQTAAVAPGVIQINETYSQFQDLVVTGAANSTSYIYGISLLGSYSAAVGCLVYELTNSGSGVFAGILSNVGAGNYCYIVNCLIHACESLSAWQFTGNSYWYNVTCTNSPGYGFYQEGATAGIAKNCASSSNTLNDWTGTWTKTTCTAEDATPVYVNSTGDNFHLDGLDTVCKDGGTDLSGDGTYAFDDDIDGDIRSGSWDIGFDESLVILQSITYNNNNTWTSPSVIGNGNNVLVECWGPGGAGGSNNATTAVGGGGGGGGGAYVNAVVAVTPSTGYAIVCGAGGAYGASNNSNGANGSANTSFNTTTVVAGFGHGGNRNGVAPTSYSSRGSGGNASNSTGDIKYNGGNGAAGASGAGGGGGAAAGTTGAGASGSGTTGGTGAGGGGSGGTGGTAGSNANGTDGSYPGGGGGGSSNGALSTKRGGNGAVGSVKLTWIVGDISILQSECLASGSKMAN